MSGRPGKAVVVVAIGEVGASAVIDTVVREGICGRMALRRRENWRDRLGDEESLKIYDEAREGAGFCEDVARRVLESKDKIVYLFSANLGNIEAVVELTMRQNWFLTVILSEILEISQSLHEIAPKQSYRFEHCEEISEEITDSVFYVDFERHYTRKDWLHGLADAREIGANQVILCERHHIELLSRLGLKSKYGS